MPANSNAISPDEQERIEALYLSGLTLKEVGQIVGRAENTISERIPASMKRSRRKTIDCLPDDEGTFEDWQQACKDMDKAFRQRVVAVHGGAA